MPQPTPSQVHVNGPLTNISVAYIQSADAFVASKVFPVVPVGKQSDLYYIYTKNDWFRDEAERRAPATESAGSGYGLSTASYDAKVWAFHKDVPDQVRENADVMIQPDADATRFVTQRLMLRREVQWAADYFQASVWGTDVTPANLWSDYTNSDPISDVRLGVKTILSTTGFKPNKLTLGYDVFQKLQDHPDIIDRLKYTGGTTRAVTKEQLAALFDIEEVLVCEAIKATNVEGETAAMAFVHGKHALLCHCAMSPSLLTPSCGYIFEWRGVSYGMGKAIGIKKFRMELLAADRIEGQIAFDDKVVATDLGYFFANVVA